MANQESATPGRLLVAMDSEYSCHQIKQYLLGGGQKLMASLLGKLEAKPVSHACSTERLAAHSH